MLFQNEVDPILRTLSFLYLRRSADRCGKSIVFLNKSTNWADLAHCWQHPLMGNAAWLKGMAIWVVEFSNKGYKIRFLPKNQHTQRNLLNFENWVNGGIGEVSKSAKIWLSKSIFYFKNYLNLSKKKCHGRISFQEHISCYWHFSKTSIFKPLYFLKWRSFFDNFYSTDCKTKPF